MAKGKVDDMKLCFECRKKYGWVGRDNGAHTAMRQTCEGCGEIKSILPTRHWKKANERPKSKKINS